MSARIFFRDHGELSSKIEQVLSSINLKQATSNNQANKPAPKQSTMAAIASKINALVATALQEAQTT
ncbi:MAG: hypothetical protein ACK55I_06930, partial [bacterium]